MALTSAPGGAVAWCPGVARGHDPLTWGFATQRHLTSEAGRDQCLQPWIEIARQVVDRPPAKIQRFITDDELGVRRGTGDELQVQVPGRHAQRACDRVHVHGGQLVAEPKIADPGFLGGFPQCSGGYVFVGVPQCPPN